MKTFHPFQSSLPRVLRVGLHLGILVPIALYAPSIHAQQVQDITESDLASITLPDGAKQVALKSVPHEITDELRALIKAGGDGVKQGRTEVMGWSGTEYKKSKAAQYKTKVATNLKNAGWTYEEGDKVEGAQDATMMSAVKTVPSRKALVGFWVPTNDALILAWTEMLPAKSNAAPAETGADNDGNAPTENATADVNEDVAEDTPPTPPATTQPAKNTTSTIAAPAGAATFELGDYQASVNVMKNAMPKLPTFPALAPKPGYARGYVKDSNGKPLANARIGVRSTAVGGAMTSADAKTDAKGYYELMVPFGVADFYNAAYAIDYGEGRAALGLHPADGEADSFASNKGVVENWVMLPYGIADRDDAQDQPQYLNNYYGGSISVTFFKEDLVPATGLPTGSVAEITLIPQGPLVDGSKGGSFVIRKPVKEMASDQFIVNNIPVGTYKIIAHLKQGNSTKPLRMKATGTNNYKGFGISPSEAQESATLTFRPYSAKPEGATPSHGHWDSVQIDLSR